MPGSGKQSTEVQAQIKELLEAGFDPTTIHRRLKVGRSSIYRMRRCLQQHGTNYMPPELNKKNGRPKVLVAEQELEVLTWLRNPANRTRYLDDLVWLIHDRFGIVCSTTTMSKMKRKWLRVIAYEETGQPIDNVTRQQLIETHPDLPLLKDLPPMDGSQQRDPQTESNGQDQAGDQGEAEVEFQPPPRLAGHINPPLHSSETNDSGAFPLSLHLALPPDPHLNALSEEGFDRGSQQQRLSDDITPPINLHLENGLGSVGNLHFSADQLQDNAFPLSSNGVVGQVPEIDARLEQQLHDEITAAAAIAAATAAAATSAVNGHDL